MDEMDIQTCRHVTNRSFQDSESMQIDQHNDRQCSTYYMMHGAH